MGSSSTENKHSITLEYWEDGKYLVGQLMEYPEVISQGETLDELVANIRDAQREMEASTRPRKRAGVTRKHKTKRLELAA